jgi:GT2 family glycosyltransferase
VIVNWNARDYLLDAVASIYREWGSDDAEVIVVDNASGDDSLAAIGETHPKAVVIANPTNAGFARGNNLGLEAATGDLIFFVNVDAFLLPGSLQAMIGFMDANPDVGLMGPRVLNTDHTLQMSARRRPTFSQALARALALDNLIDGLTFHDHSSTGDVEVLSGCFWVVRRAALNEVGPLDEGFFMYAEDVDWSKRFADAGWRVVYFPGAEIVHHGGKSSLQAPVRFFVEMRKADLRYWRKHHGTAQMLGYAAVLMLHHTIRVVAGLMESALPGRRSNGRAKATRSGAVVRWIIRARGGLRPVEVPHA